MAIDALKYSNSARYLGTNFDMGLTFNRHIMGKADKARKKLMLIRGALKSDQVFSSPGRS